MLFVDCCLLFVVCGCVLIVAHCFLVGRVGVARCLLFDVVRLLF